MLALSAAAGETAEVAQWFARAGTLDTAHKNAYRTLINGLVGDGVWGTLDALYVLATSSSTPALLNLVSSSYPVTANGSPTFTADSGYTGSSADFTHYLDTGFNAATAGGKYSQNSATWAIWNFTNAGTNDSPGGASDGTTIGTDVHPYTDGNAYADINSNVGSRIVASVAGVYNGSYSVTRTGATAWSLYKDGSSIGSSSVSSAAPASRNFWILLRNQPPGINGSAYQIPVTAFGSGWSGTQALAFYTRIAAYLDAIHGSH